MDLGLKDKKALVIGGSDGLGFAVASALVQEGARVVIASRNSEKLSRAKAKLDAICLGKTEVRQADVGNEETLKGLVDPGIDILVNNSGGPAAGDPLEISLEDWDRGYQTLVRSVLVLTKAVVPHMEKKKWGRILTITSTSAKEIIPKLPISSTFRSGLSGLTKELAKAVGRRGILVNNLLPGPTVTNRLKELSEKSPEFYQSLESRSALGRLGDPAEIGRVAAFLCSAANTFITGTDVLVDGGFTSAL